MDDAATLIETLRQEGVSLWAEAGRLRHRGPEAALTPDRLARLDSLQTEALALLKGQRREPMPRRPEGAPIPLSFTQERMWLRCQTLPYLRDKRFGGFALKLTGPLDHTLLAQALAVVVERHEGLRTRIVAASGTPAAVIDPLERYCLQTVDCSSGAAAETEEVRAFMDEVAEWGARAPLFAAKLIRRGPAEHLLLIGWHHLLYDGVSVQILLGELFKTYGGLARDGQAPRLPPLPIQYPDFAAWMRDPTQTHHGDYWRETLARGALIDPPRDIAPGAVEPNLKGVHAIRLPEATAQGLRRLSQERRIMPPLIGYTAVAAAVGEWCGLSDFIFPFYHHGRDRLELDGMVGSIAYPLHLLVQLRAGEPMGELLGRLASEYWAACRHPDCSWVAFAYPDYLNAIHFNWLSGTTTPAGLSDLGLEVADNPITQDHNRWLALLGSTYFVDDGQAISCILTYRADYYSAAAMERLGARILARLEELVAA